MLIATVAVALAWVVRPNLPDLPEPAQAAVALATGWATGRLLRGAALASSGTGWIGPWCATLAGLVTSGTLLFDVVDRMQVPLMVTIPLMVAALALLALRGRSVHGAGLRTAPGPTSISGHLGAIALSTALLFWNGAAYDLNDAYRMHLDDGRVIGAVCGGLGLGLLLALLRPVGAMPAGRRAGDYALCATGAATLLIVLLPLVPGGNVNALLHDLGLPKRLELIRDIPLGLICFGPAALFLGLAVGLMPKVLPGARAAACLGLGLVLAAGTAWLLEDFPDTSGWTPATLSLLTLAVAGFALRWAARGPVAASGTIPVSAPEA